MIANIVNSEIGNWDEDEWWVQDGGSVGEFYVDAWITLESTCEEEEVKTDHFDYNGVYLVVNGDPWIEFKGDGEEINFSSYLEQLNWELYEIDSSKEDCSS